MFGIGIWHVRITKQKYRRTRPMKMIFSFLFVARNVTNLAVPQNEKIWKIYGKREHCELAWTTSQNYQAAIDVRLWERFGCDVLPYGTKTVDCLVHVFVKNCHFADCPCHRVACTINDANDDDDDDDEDDDDDDDIPRKKGKEQNKKNIYHMNRVSFASPKNGRVCEYVWTWNGSNVAPLWKTRWEMTPLMARRYISTGTMCAARSYPAMSGEWRDVEK